MRHLGVLAAAPAVTALAAVAACTGGPGPTGPGTTAPATSPEPTTAGTSSPGATETQAAAQVDCAAVEQARQELADATNAELARLDIDRSDPRAFNVQVLVTAQQAAEYWTTVREAVPDSEDALRSDAATVASYWLRLDADLDAIEIADGSEPAVQQATARYLEVTAQHPEEEVLPVQERLTARLEAACAEESAG